ncbi:MAG: hypothetical protein ONB44_07640 [candidate division KSB1 bacterium]|nr:hypothetical protein [candidate division KSB1 bacterium]MDZ7301999.1 hypothetical protein [candidate division KSB1 bacterium]MDZ7310181.1 hypothetical protein [candidate division KSB1 bacterium]
MNHIEEQVLETYIRRPEKLPDSVHQCVATHLASCAACSAITDFLHSFYADLDNTPDEVSPRMEALIEMPSTSPFIIPLRPFQSQPEAVAFADGYTTVLAAMSPATPRQRFQTVATFAAERHRTLVRILHDSATNNFKLYLLADDPRKREGAIVSFPKLAADFVTDERGRVAFQLPGHEQPQNWTTLEAELRLPVAEVCLSPDQLKKTSPPEFHQIYETIAAEHTATFSYADKVLTLNVRPLQPEVQAITRAVVKGATGQTFLITLHGGKAELLLDPLPETLTIRFYC